jgi:nicotinamidase-related amidase
MIGQTARLSDVAHDLGGRYDGWDVDFYKDTRSFVPVSDPANRPVTGINWHSFERTYAPYPQSLSILYEPQKAYQYMQDAGSDRFFSVLHADDVSQLMSKLRKQEGCLDVFRFQHFDNRYVTELTEILQKNYYSTVKFCGDFTDLAYAADRLGNRQVAITLAFHAMSTGEDFETMADQLDEMNETDLGVACKRKADFDALNEQVKPVPNRCDATKHKI